MKILIELPTWLGDAVMVTPAIENLIKHLGDVEITFLGSLMSIDTLKNHPKVIKTYVIDKNFFHLHKILRDLEDFDVFISFRSSLRTTVIKFFISSKNKYQFNKKNIKKAIR